MVLSLLNAVSGTGAELEISSAPVSASNPVPMVGPGCVWLPGDSGGLTRPANATPYTAHDGMGSSSTSVIKISNFFRINGGTATFAGMSLRCSTTAAIAIPDAMQVRAHLYNALPASAPVDNAPFSMLVANEALRLGSVDFTAWITGDANSTLFTGAGVASKNPWAMKAASDARDLYVLLEALSAFTPISQMVLMPYVGAILD